VRHAGYVQGLHGWVAGFGQAGAVGATALNGEYEKQRRRIMEMLTGKDEVHRSWEENHRLMVNQRSDQWIESTTIKLLTRWTQQQYHWIPPATHELKVIAPWVGTTKSFREQFQEM
jgi:hypothetical protein